MSEYQYYEFAAKTIATRNTRQKEEAGAAAAKRQREAELRKQHLATVMQRAFAPDQAPQSCQEVSRPEAAGARDQGSGSQATHDPGRLSRITR